MLKRLVLVCLVSAIFEVFSLPTTSNNLEPSANNAEPEIILSPVEGHAAGKQQPLNKKDTLTHSAYKKEDLEKKNNEKLLQGLEKRKVHQGHSGLATKHHDKHENFGVDLLKVDRKDVKAVEKAQNNSGEKEEIRSGASLLSSCRSNKGSLKSIEGPNHFHSLDSHSALKKFDELKSEHVKDPLVSDLDVFLFSNPPMYKSYPSTYGRLYSREQPSNSYEHLYPYLKMMQRRSPLQNALEVANVLVKVGLDELDDSDDYNEQLPFLFEQPKTFRKGGKIVDKGCPLHPQKKELSVDDENVPGQEMVQICSCHLLKKGLKDSKLTETNELSFMPLK